MTTKKKLLLIELLEKTSPTSLQASTQNYSTEKMMKMISSISVVKLKEVSMLMLRKNLTRLILRK